MNKNNHKTQLLQNSSTSEQGLYNVMSDSDPFSFAIGTCFEFSFIVEIMPSFLISVLAVIFSQFIKKSYLLLRPRVFIYKLKGGFIF